MHRGVLGGSWAWALPRGWLGSFLVKDKGIFVPFYTLSLPITPSLPIQGHVEGSLMPCNLGNVLGSRVEW